MKGCNFKPLRGLNVSTITPLLEQMTEEELSIPELAKKCRKVKALRDMQKTFIEEIGVMTCEEATAKFPVSAEAPDQFF